MKKLIKFVIVLIGLFTLSCEQSIQTEKTPLTKSELVNSLTSDENINSIPNIRQKYDKLLFEEFAKLSDVEFKEYKKLLDEQKYDDARQIVKEYGIQKVLDRYKAEMNSVAQKLVLKYSQDFKQLDPTGLKFVIETSLEKTSQNAKKANYCSDFCEGYQYAVYSLALTQAVLCLTGYSYWCGNNAVDYSALGVGVACAFCCLNNCR